MTFMNIYIIYKNAKIVDSIEAGNSQKIITKDFDLHKPSHAYCKSSIKEIQHMTVTHTQSVGRLNTNSQAKLLQKTLLPLISIFLKNDL